MSEAGLLADPQEVRAILVASAQAGQAISYSEVLELLGHHFTRPKMRQLCKVLTFVDEEAEERGEPELAVSSSDSRTGFLARAGGSVGLRSMAIRACGKGRRRRS